MIILFILRKVNYFLYYCYLKVKTGVFAHLLDPE